MDHHETDGFPPQAVAAPQRMWAGSDCEFLAPLEIGAEISRRSRIDAVEQKQGSSGPLTFVTILHETSADGTLAVRQYIPDAARERARFGVLDLDLTLGARVADIIAHLEGLLYGGQIRGQLKE